MSTVTKLTITNLTQMSDLTRFLQPFLDQVNTALNKGLTLSDNFTCSVVPVNFPGTANQNLVVNHNLSVTPSVYIVGGVSAACRVYNGNSPVFSSKSVNLKCDVASISATLIFF